MTAPDVPAVLLRSPADCIAIVPYLLGFHPQDSIVAIAFNTDTGTRTDAPTSADRDAGSGVGAFQGVVRFDLPPSCAYIPDLAEQFRAILTRTSTARVLLLGYGDGVRVTPVMDAVRGSLAVAGIEVLDALRVQDGLYWSYVCADPGCCPPSGVPYDCAGNPVAAGAVWAGLVALPDRDALADTIAPVGGGERERMRAATRAARAHATSQLATRDGHSWYREGLDRIIEAFERIIDEREISDAEVAWLGVLLTAIGIRDAAMTFIGRYADETHLRLWTELTRRVEPGYLAAPASLLAFVALGAGNGPLARVAVERALADDPGYRLAGLVREALDAGLPPSVVAEMDCASLVDQIADQVSRNPAAARPTLPTILGDGR